MPECTGSTELEHRIELTRNHLARAGGLAIGELLAGAPAKPAAECVICPPFVYLYEAARLLRDSIFSLGAQDVHAFIRARIAERDAKIAAATRILYGGSVKAGNAAELFAMPDVDGGLVGGASLKADEFLTILGAARAKG